MSQVVSSFLHFSMARKDKGFGARSATAYCLKDAKQFIKKQKKGGKRGAMNSLLNVTECNV